MDRPPASPTPDAPVEAAPREHRLGALGEYWSVLLRRKFTVAAVFLVTCGLVIAATLTLEPTYRAQATLLIKFGREFIYRPEVGSPADSRTFSLGEMVNSEVEILNSREVAEQVVREIGPARLYPALLEQDYGDEAILARAVGTFRENVSVLAVLESSVIKVSFEHPDRRLAAEALNLLVDKFTDKHLEIFSDAKASFLGTQLQQYEDKLRQAEAALESFRQEHSVFDLVQERSLLLAQRAELDTELKNADLAVCELEQKLPYVSGAAGGPPAPPEPAEGRPLADVDSLLRQRGDLDGILKQAEFRLAELKQLLLRLDERSRLRPEGAPAIGGEEDSRALEEAFVRLLDLQLKEEDLLQQFSEDSTRVVAVRKAIQIVRDFMQGRGAYLQSAREAVLRDELDAVSARKGAVLEQLERMDAEIRSADLQRTLAALAPLQARRTRIVQELGELDRRLRDLDRHVNRLRSLERDVELSERNYQAYVDKSEEARISEELDRQKMINIRVVERASPPMEPAGLSKKLRIALGMAAGLVAGVAVALFLELIRP